MRFILVNIILILCCFGCNSQVGTQEQSTENKREVEVQKINILSSSQIGDTLELVSDDSLVWKPFVVELSVEELQRRYGNVFKVDDQSNVIELQGEEVKIILIKNISVENAEKLAEHHHTAVPTCSIKEIEISNPLIELQYGIRVGMNKEDFFKMINFSPAVGNSVNIVQIFDPPGEMIEQSYVFKDGKLEVIKMKSPY